jgi:hypothetical protein
LDPDWANSNTEEAMRCPACDERAIDFVTWGHGFNAFIGRDCPNCGARLKVSRRTVWVTLGLLVVVIALAVGMIEGGDRLKIPWLGNKLAFAVVLIPLVFAGGFWEWYTGRYSLAHPDAPIDRSDEPPPSE